MMLVEETAVPQWALPVAELKDHLRFGSGFSDDALQDTVLESYLRAAMAAIEARTGKVLIERTFSWTLTIWRDPRRQPLPVGPVNALTGVTLVTYAGDETAAEAATWCLQPDQQRPSLLATGTSLPAIPHNGSVRIGLLAGFGPEWSDLPADLAQAVIMLAAHYYEFRGETRHGAPAIPVGVTALIAPYRPMRLFMGGAV